MKYFLDCEFYEDGKTIDMVSIGVVAEDGREFYAVNADFEFDRIYSGVTAEQWQKTAWLRDNVMGQIDRAKAIPASCIRDQLRDFVLFQPEQDGFVPAWYPVEFWGYFAASDWVCLYQLWGRLLDLPKQFPKWCRDIKQLQHALSDEYGNLPQLPFDPKIHHALRDAKWQKIAYDTLIEYAKTIAEIEHIRLPLALFGIK